MGHLGVSLFMLSVWFVFQSVGSTTNMVRFVQVTGIGAGFYLCLASNSRGPLFALLVCIAALFFFSGARRRIGIIVLIIAGSLSALPLAKYLNDVHGISTYSRIFNQSQVQQAKGDARLDLYANALSSFADKPFLGSGLEEYKIGFYPHNVIIESLMATGVFGGALFILLIVALLINGARSYKQDPSTGWAFLLALQYIVGAQFSGALYSSGPFWISIALLIVILSPGSVRKYLR